MLKVGVPVVRCKLSLSDLLATIEIQSYFGPKSIGSILAKLTWDVNGSP